MTLPVALYIPNLLGYARINLAFLGLHYSQTKPVLACLIWIFSASLDLIDGILARALNQCSSLGVLLDIGADNILRTTTWMAASAEGSHQLVAALLISLEWTTMVCTQLHATQSGNHWKESRENDPWLVRAMFANNFKTLLGAWCVYGLFSAGFFAYASHHQVFAENIPLFDLWKYLAFSGRGITVLAELWLCKGYLSLVIERDTEARSESTKKDS
jgi:phosphatidylglycerophosphate synthase